MQHVVIGEIEELRLQRTGRTLGAEVSACNVADDKPCRGYHMARRRRQNAEYRALGPGGGGFNAAAFDDVRCG